MIVQEIQQFLRYIERNIFRDKNWTEMLHSFHKQLQPVEGIVGK